MDRYRVANIRIGLVAGLLALATVGIVGDAGSAAPPSVVDGAVRARIADRGSAKVMVILRAPAEARSLRGQVTAVRSVRARVLADAGDAFRPTARWDAVPAIPGWITRQGLERLQADPAVLRIGLDGGAAHAADIQSSKLIRANQAHQLGYTGDGVTVAVIDSGIDEGHPDLHPAIVGEHCFNDCPLGVNRAQDQEGHGTNVAGIVASRGTISPLGIAPKADLVAEKVLDRNGRTQSSDPIISALNWLALNRPDVKVVNMSLVSDELFGGYCDNVETWTMAMSSAVETLHSAGVTVFASSGNDKTTNEMAAPACLKNVVAVGAVYDSAYGSDQLFCHDRSRADRVTCFSDSSPALDLLAPGARITSTGLRSQGSPISTYYGTSQASPHAAATAALILQKHPAVTPDQVEAVLKATGKRITDWRNQRVTPRIDALAAATTQPGPKTLTVSTTGSATGSITSNPVGIACPATCTHTFDFGAPVILSAAPAAGKFFVGWSGDCAGRASCLLAMGANQRATAEFSRFQCVVPHLRGKTLVGAKHALRKAHCSLGAVKRGHSRVKRGRVISQRPRAGRKLPDGTAIDVKISRGRRR